MEKQSKTNDSKEVGTIVYSLNLERELKVEMRCLRRREFNWESGQVDGRKKEFKQPYLNNTSSHSGIINKIRSIDIPINLYSTLSCLWVKLMSGGIIKQNPKIKHCRNVIGISTSIYMALLCYALSQTSMASISTTYSTILVM